MKDCGDNFFLKSKLENKAPYTNKTLLNETIYNTAKVFGKVIKNSEDEIGSVMRVVPNSDALHISENLEKSNVRFFYRHWKGDSNTNTYEAGGDISSEISTEELESKVGRKLNGWGDDTVICEGVTYKKCFLKPYYKKA